MEEASLRFSKEFPNAKLLSVAEVAVILQHYEEQGMQFKRLQEYTTRANRFPHLQATQQARTLLSNAEFLEDRSLTDLQIVLMMNLCPQSAQEARRCVPGLEQLTDDELDKLTSQLSALQVNHELL